MQMAASRTEMFTLINLILGILMISVLVIYVLSRVTTKQAKYLQWLSTVRIMIQKMNDAAEKKQK